MYSPSIDLVFKHFFDLGEMNEIVMFAKICRSCSKAQKLERVSPPQNLDPQENIFFTGLFQSFKSS